MSSSPTWTDIMTGFGTVGAVVVALGLAVRDQIERTYRERRKQADQVTGWWEHASGTTVRATVKNASEQCVYRVVACVVAMRGNDRASTQPLVEVVGSKALARIGLIRPGAECSGLLEHRGGAMGLKFGAEFAFRDAAGRCWVRRASGLLEKISQDPLYYYGQFEPTSWENG